jgi:acyl carrier protein
MSEKNIEKIVIEKIKELCKNHNVNITIDDESKNRQFKDLGIDSLLVLTFIVEIEKELGKKLPDEILLKISTINELIDEFKKH